MSEGPNPTLDSATPRVALRVRTAGETRTSFQGALPQLQKAITRFAGMGVRVSKGSRLWEYEQIVGANAQSLEVGILGMPRFKGVELALVVREIDELTQIVSTLPDKLDHELRERLRNIAGGHLIPDTERGSPPRESQFELWLRGMCVRARLRTVLGTPDLQVTMGKKVLGIEAKRPNSIKRLDDNFHDAIHALERHTGPRLVAIQLDQIWRPPGGWFEVTNGEEVPVRSREAMKVFIEKLGHVGRKRCSGRGIAAIMYSLSTPGWITRDARPAVAKCAFYDFLIERDHPDVVLVRRWAERAGIHAIGMASD